LVAAYPPRPLDLQRLYQAGVLGGELLVDRAKRRLGFLVQRDRRRVEGCEFDQILDLDAGPGAHERGFARIRRQRCGPSGVPPVER